MDFMFFFSESSSGDFNYAAVFSLFGVVIAAIFSIRAVLINIKSKNVDEERIKWRESIRRVSNDLVSLVEKEKKEIAYNELVMRLNPSDEYDREILVLAKEIVDGDNGKNDSFIKVISFMLKYDWERCKLESRFFKVFYEVNVNGCGRLTKNIIIDDNDVTINIVMKGCGIILYQFFIFCSVVISIISTVMYFQSR
ncbi:hypothetical protein [Morganella morganii]|nr:hypothetical protein [Morganella morganii]